MGEIISVTGNKVVVRDLENKQHTYLLRKYQRSNQSTCIDQRPAWLKVSVSTKATSSPIHPLRKRRAGFGQKRDRGVYFLGRRQFEDAILISERLVQDDAFYLSAH